MTPPSESIVELEKRLEQASGPDRELDYAIFDYFDGEWMRLHGYVRDGDNYYSHTPVCGVNRIKGPEGYTSSIDAALALVSRVCPRLSLCFLRYPNGVWGIGASTTCAPQVGENEYAESRIPVLICLAAVRALKTSVP